MIKIIDESFKARKFQVILSTLFCHILYVGWLSYLLYTHYNKKFHIPSATVNQLHVYFHIS